MLKKILQTLKNIPEAVWDVYAVKNELLRDKITQQQWTEFIGMAHTIGKKLARETVEKYPQKTVLDIFAALDLDLARINDTPDRVNTVFACYIEPKRIEIYEKNIRLACQVLRNENCENLLDDCALEEVLLAHELFHYIAYTMPELAINQKLVTLWHIGSFKYCSRIRTISEIAAMEFTRGFLQLTYAPYILDVLFLYSSDRDRAIQLYEYITKIEVPKAEHS
jgi:hypothetical protein